MIHVIAAIGNSGQIGINGGLPWVNRRDLALFQKVTVNSTIIVGYNTFLHLPVLRDRFVVVWKREDPLTLLANVHNRPFEDIWIAGGAKTYSAFAPFVSGLRVFSHIPYNGPADAYFPFKAYELNW